MARVISFFPKQVYIGHNTNSLVTLSEIFEINGETMLELQLRIYGCIPIIEITGSVETTSDATFIDAAWKVLSGTFTRNGPGTTWVSLSGSLQRFVRARIEVPQNGQVSAALLATARGP